MGLGLHRAECLGGIGKISPESNALGTTFQTESLNIHAHIKFWDWFEG